MFAAAANAIRDWFRDRAVGAVATALGPVLYDNVDTPAIPGAGRYVRFRVLDGAGTQITCGTTARYRATGRVVVELFDPLGIGDGAQLANADTVAAMFRGKRIASPMVAFDPPSITEGTRAGAFFLRSVVVPFRADAVVTT